MPPDGAFTAWLLLLVSTVSALTVPPPTNVMVSCSNVRAGVSWEFSGQQPPTSFRVETQSSDGHHENETTEHQYDLTGFIWKSQEHFMGFHSVRVTARQGGVESQPVQSQSFTFNMNRLADKHCVLDLPPVEVEADDSGTRVSFQNPFYFYTELRQAQKQETAVFQFNVTSDQGEYPSECRLTEPVCRFDLPHSEEQCVRIRGWLDSGNHAEIVEFRETDQICARTPRDPHVITFVIVLIAFVLVISVLSIVICKVRAWTLEPSKTPKPVIFPDIRPNIGRYQVLDPVEEQISLVMVIEPSSSSSLSSEDGASSCSGKVYKYASMEEGLLEPGEQEEAANEEPADEEQDREGNYDRAHVLVPLEVWMDIGDGELVAGYKEG